MTVLRLMDKTENKIFEAYWMFKNTKEAAEYAEVSPTTIINFYNRIKYLYKENVAAIPKNTFIDSIFGDEKVLTFEEILKRIHLKTGKHVRIKTLKEQLEILKSVGRYAEYSDGRYKNYK